MSINPACMSAAALAKWSGLMLSVCTLALFVYSLARTAPNTPTQSAEVDSSLNSARHIELHSIGAASFTLNVAQASEEQAQFGSLQTALLPYLAAADLRFVCQTAELGRVELRANTGRLDMAMHNLQMLDATLIGANGVGGAMNEARIDLESGSMVVKGAHIQTDRQQTMDFLDDRWRCLAQQ